MTASSRVFFLAFTLLAAAPGCGDDDDDDDTIGGEGEGEGEVCDVRTCNDPGQECCDTDTGTACVNSTNNFNHCGGCGEACDNLAANLCVESSCACGESDPCDGTAESTCCPVPGLPAQCVDTLSNAEACGGCNNNCIAPGAPEKQSDRCNDGECVCGDTGEACDGMLASTCCPEEGGGAACHNVQTEVENCGGCSLADRTDPRDGEPDLQFRCSAEVSNICRLAQCVCGIPEDIGIDPAPCLGGRASTCCAPANPQDADLAVCANLDTDELNCGQCNNPCGKGENCTNGTCG